MKSINPATEQVIAEYSPATRPEIDQALTKAELAFERWRNMPIHRASLMKRAGEVLRENRRQYAELMTAEVGKPIVASEAEVDKCAAGCDYFAENAGRFLKPRVVESDASRSYVRFDPLGPVLAIMPWNFPFWQVIRFAAPALMAGNVGVLKHAPNVPGCALALEQIFGELGGFPKGVFTSLLISDNAVAEKLVEHSAIRAVTLTGSDRAGRAVAAAAGRVLKKTVMELGGSDPFIVLADADVDAVAKKAAEARCINNGQSCIAAKRFIVESAIIDQFEWAMVKAMSEMKVGDPMDRATQIGPLARLDLLEALDSQVRRSVEQGAKLLTGGKRVSRVGYFYEPTVLADVRPGMPAFDEETFGPVAAIVVADDVKECLRPANLSQYGLGASIWTRDVSQAEALAEKIEAGSVFINGIVKSDPRLPFGGIKNSGWGRELSEFGIHEFVNIKTVWVK